MTRLGFITNYQAGRNRKRPERIRSLVNDIGGDAYDVADLDSIRDATRRLGDAGTDVIVVNGGDGTVHAVLTRLMRLDSPMPLVAAIPGGTTNLTANDLSGPMTPEQALERLGQLKKLAPDALPRVGRRVLEVTVDDAEPQYGLIMSAGATLRGMEHFRDNVASRGFRGELAAGFSVARGLFGVARGKTAWTAKHLADVRWGDDPDWRRDRIMFIGTTMDRLMLGFRPWWGGQTEPIHVTALRQRPTALMRVLPSFLRGRRHHLMMPANGYRSANVDSFELRSGSGFALDGEIFPLASNERVRVRATEPVSFLRLDSS